MLEETAKKIVKLQVKYPKIVLLIIAFITILLIPGILKVKIEPSLEKVLPEDLPVIKTMNDMRNQFGADMVLEVSSIASIVKEKDGFISDSKRRIELILDEDPRTLKLTNKDYSLTFLQLRTDTGTNANLIKKLKFDIKDDIASLEELNPGLKAHVTGFNLIDKATFDIMISDFAFETPLAFVFIGIVVFIVFRSFLKGFIPMVVVMISMLWTTGMIGYFGIVLSSTNIVAAAMLMGLGIDFGIHILYRFYELKAKNSRENALVYTLRESIRALLAAALTTIAAFLSLLSTPLPAIKNFGIILSIGIASALVAAIVALPVVIFLYDTYIDKNIKLAKS
ncbi:MMPL family transporter [Candidatus Woesearchaeota archaeon]|nr:MMPL family transporter [Candidatus Woesearchaeota archaeon]